MTNLGGDQCLEPLGRKDRKFTMPVSLRGSLAEQYLQLAKGQSKEKAEEFVSALLAALNPDVVRVNSPEGIVIGLQSERGKFFPDW